MATQIKLSIILQSLKLLELSMNITKMHMQSGLMKTKEWVLEYIVHNEQINPLMGWQSSSNTLSEVKMTFNSKEDAIDYAKKNKINYIVVEPNKRSIVKKSYADNFLK